MSDDSTIIPAITTTERKPASFRLTLQTLRLIALAVNDARAHGRLATKGEVIEQAIRATYGHLDEPGDEPGNQGGPAPRRSTVRSPRSNSAV